MKFPVLFGQRVLIVLKLKFQDFRFEYLVEVDWLWDEIKGL